MSDTLSQYALAAECDALNTDDTSNLFRIWCYSLTVAMLFVVLFVVPMFWCQPVSAAQERKFNRGVEGAAPVSPGHEGPDETEKGKHAKRGRSILEVDAAHAAPDLAAARQNLRDSSNTREDGSWRPLWGTSKEDIGQIGGMGIRLYFRLLQGIGICFCFMTMITAPMAVFSWHGNFVPDMGQPLAKMTIGNLGTIAPDGILQESRFIIIGCQAMDIKKYTRIFAYCDALAIVVFWLYLQNMLTRILPLVLREADAISVRITDYAVEIDMLPPTIHDHASYEQFLTLHIQKRIQSLRGDDAPATDGKEPIECKVCEVCLVRDHGGRLGSISARAQLLRKKDICEYKQDVKQKAKLEEQVKQLSANLRHHTTPEASLPVIRAYCVLNSSQDAEKLLINYRFSNFALMRCCQRRQNRFRGHAIRVRQAPEPTNIIPENQDVTKCSRRIRRLIILVLWTVALCIAASLIFYMGRTAKAEGGASGSQLGSPTCDAGTSPPSDTYKCNYQVAIHWTIAQASTFAEDKLGCFCQTRGHANVIQNSELRDGLCKDWLVDASTTALSSAGASAITVIINVVFRIIVVWMANWEKPLSVSALNRSLMWKTFASQFLNMAVLIHVLNYHSDSMNFIFNGDYKDFERGWYSVVGGAMMANMVLNSFVGAFIYLATALFLRLKRCCRKGGIKHQAELLALHMNPQFDISARYAQLLTTVFCTLVYSPGLPLLTLFGSAYCFVNYWVDKWLLLRASGRPPLYDASMPKMALQMLLWAIPAHCVIAIAMYSHACTFPSDPLGGTLATYASAVDSGSRPQDTDSSGDWQERLTRESTWMLFALFLLSSATIAAWVSSVVFGATCGQVLTVCAYACCPSLATHRKDSEECDVAARLSWEGQGKTGAKVIVEMEAPPSSYALGRHPAFSSLVKYLEDPANESSDPGPG